MSEDHMAYENRLRRAADRQGLRLVKSRRRDPRAYDYGTFMLVDVQTRGVVFGSPVSGPNGSATLDEVEEFLTSWERAPVASA